MTFLKLTVTVLTCVLLAACKPKEQAKKESRLAWNNATALQAYEKHGSKNPKWDADAKRCLSEYVKLRGGITNYEARTLAWDLTGTYAASAIEKGCDDPLIEYLSCRFSRGIPKDELTTRLCRSADKMEGSRYPPVRKFFANLRAGEALWVGRNTNVWNRVSQYRTSALNNLTEMVKDEKTPIEEIDETGHELIQIIGTSAWELKLFIDQAEPILIKNWAHSDVAYSIQAALYYNYAWRARGGGYADKVTEEGWKGFRERLSVAIQAAEKAWSLNPKNTRIPTLMIKLAEATQQPREEMERWFAKAMELEPNNYNACQCKLHYLYPQWYGSPEEMIQFGRECVESEVWTGTVPLILVEAHDQISLYIRDKEKRKAYWKQPEVWKDIASAYDRFFERNPDGIGWHHNYAWYAYLCEQWDTLNQELKLLGDVNYSYFGGEEEYNKIVQLAKKHAGAPLGK